MKRVLLLIAIVAAVVLAFLAGRKVTDYEKRMTLSAKEVAIKETLMDQQDAWNAGDIPAFMEGYWNSPELRFASGGSINKGWQITLDRYLARYPDQATMGQLEFSSLEIEQLSDRDALVFGHWALIRDNDMPNGLFTLHMRQIDGKWVVISDHTSSAE